MSNYDEIIKQSQINVNSLSEKLVELDHLYQDIKRLKAAVEGVPEIFNDKFLAIKKLTEQYTDNLGIATKAYLDGNNTLFTVRLNDLSVLSEEFKKEMKRLENIDYHKLFKDLQHVFIEWTKEDLTIELNRFEDKSKDLQAGVDSLRQQTDRLKKMDLEIYFDKFQQSMADMLAAAASIHPALTNIVQTLPVIVQASGTLQTTLDTHHNEVKQLLKSYNHLTEGYLMTQTKQVTKTFEWLDIKIKSINEQNEQLRKEMRLNRVIQLVGLALVLLIFIYIAVN